MEFNGVDTTGFSQTIGGFKVFIQVCRSFGVKFFKKKISTAVKNCFKGEKFQPKKLFFNRIRNFSRSILLNLLFFAFFRCLGSKKADRYHQLLCED